MPKILYSCLQILYKSQFNYEKLQGVDFFFFVDGGYSATGFFFFEVLTSWATFR